jgi:hypothetical protein
MPRPSVITSPKRKMELFLGSSAFHNGKCSGGKNAGGDYSGVTLSTRSDGKYQVSGHCRNNSGLWKPVEGLILPNTLHRDLKLIYDDEDQVWWLYH